MNQVAKNKKNSLPTPAESRLLQALWALGEGTVEQIVNSFPATDRPNYKTTHTFLRIMEAKGYVDHTVLGKVFIFRPTVSEHEVASASVSTLLNQSFGGSASGLLINLLESDTLDSSDLRDMEEMIRRHRKLRKEEDETP